MPYLKKNTEALFIRMRSEIEKRGWILHSNLEEEYKSKNGTKLNLACPFGHYRQITYEIFEKNADSTGKGCKDCNALKQRNTIENVQKEVAKKNCKLLSTEYINLEQQLDFKCKVCNNKFTKTLSQFRTTNCKICSNNSKITPYTKIKEEIKARNYKLLTTPEEYIDTQHQLIIECSQGHVSNILIANFRKSLNGCQKCSSINRSKEIPKSVINSVLAETKDTIENLPDLVYHNLNLLITCPEGHKRNVAAKSYFYERVQCGKCTGNANEYTFKDIIKAFNKDGYEVTSKEESYRSLASKIGFICPNDHEHEMSAGGFLDGARCLFCAHDNRRVSFEIIKAEFIKRNCILKTEKYTNSGSPLEYICENGHNGTTT